MNKPSFKIISIIVFLLFLQPGFAQNQKIADSLIKELRSIEAKDDSLRMKYLHRISYNQNNPDSSLYYAKLLEAQALKTDDKLHLRIAYADIGSALRLKGDLEESIASFFKGLEIAIETNDSESMGDFNTAIADVYSVAGSGNKAIQFYKKAISIQRVNKDSISLAASLTNAGDEYINLGKLDSALIFFEESGIIFEIKQFKVGKAYNLGNTGMVYAKLGKDEEAEDKLTEAISILEETGDYYAVSVYLHYMSDIYADKNDFKKAFNYAHKSLELAEEYNLKEQIRDANLKLSILYQKKGDFEASITHLKNYYAYRDSVINLKAVTNIADIRTNFEVSQKQIEVDLLDIKQQKQRVIIIATIISLILITLLVIGLIRRNIFIKKASSIIEKERDISKKLLRNILPEETAKELMENGKVKPQKINHASVLFTDFKGFTKLSENLSPEQLVESVNFYYSKFDEIVQKYGLEKIKTIGDAYMVAGGLPFPTEDHAVKIVEAAFEISQFVKETKLDVSDQITHFDIRIGVNSGPVVAGVVGIKKFAYDIWGDTVNIASRMESNSEPGKINVSESTYEFIKHKFDCTFRGEIETKNRGKLKMYFVDNMKADIEG